MFLIKTEIRKSSIPNAGNGVFTLEDIKAGQVIWKFEPGVDFIIFTDVMETYSEAVQEYHKRYSYRTIINGTDCYVFCGDNGKHMNHSNNPNTDDSGIETCIALIDIKAGEELTCDYRSFDLDSKDGVEF